MFSRNSRKVSLHALAVECLSVRALSKGLAESEIADARESSGGYFCSQGALGTQEFPQQIWNIAEGMISKSIYWLLRRKKPFYVVSHERSGTHLALNLFFRNLYVSQAFHDFTEWQGPFADLENLAPHWEAFAQGWPDRSTRGGLIKTHATLGIFRRYLPSAPVVYVMRDPRDTLVSFFHYLNNSTLYENNPKLESQRCENFSEFLRRPLSDFLQYNFSDGGNLGNVMERWASHVSEWLRFPGVTVVTYEDLRNDFTKVVRQVAWEVRAMPKLKMVPVTFGEKGHVLPRKGVVGDWKSVFSSDDQRVLSETLAKYQLSLDRWDRIS